MRLIASVLAASLIGSVAHAAPRDEAAQLRARAVAEIARGEDRQALRDLEQAYLVWPVPTTLMDLAELHVRLGEIPLAISSLRILIDSKKDDPDAADLVAHAQLRLAVLENPSKPPEPDAVTPAPPPQPPLIDPIDEAPTPDTVRAPSVQPFEDEKSVPVVAPIEDYVPPKPNGAALDRPIQAPTVKPKVDKLVITFAVIGGAAGLLLTFYPLIWVAGGHNTSSSSSALTLHNAP
jgi:hypothetical protein